MKLSRESNFLGQSVTRSSHRTAPHPNSSPKPGVLLESLSLVFLKFTFSVNQLAKFCLFLSSSLLDPLVGEWEEGGWTYHAPHCRPQVLGAVLVALGKVPHPIT